MYAQNWAVKSNLLYDVTSTINLETEFGVGKKLTMDVSANLNPWNYSDRTMKHWLVQPELRYWVCKPFLGTFWGIHAHYGKFNVNSILPFRTDLDYRYEGWLVGAGVSVGHQWIISNRWSVEAELGVGYAHIKSDKFACWRCGRKVASEHTNYFGPTKVALSFMYFIK